MELDSLFERLEDWLAKNAPNIHAELTPGASDAELDELEIAIGHHLPAAFRALYRHHTYWSQTFPLDHVPLHHVFFEWHVWQELEAEFQETEGHSSYPPGAITPQYINLGWIPFLKDWGGNSVGIDLAPGPQGVKGQVITFGRDVKQKYVLAASLEEFLTEYLERLETGQVRVIEGEDLDFPDQQHLALTDSMGVSVDTYYKLADLFPGFGISPHK